MKSYLSLIPMDIERSLVDEIKKIDGVANAYGSSYPPLFCCVLQRRLQDGFSRTATIKFIWILK